MSSIIKTGRKGVSAKDVLQSSSPAKVNVSIEEQVEVVADDAVKRIEELENVSVAVPAAGQVLKYVGGEWVPSADLEGAAVISDLSDVDSSGAVEGDVLVYDSANSKWVSATNDGAGDMKGANNLSDVADATTSRANLGAASQADLTTAQGDATQALADAASAQAAAAGSVATHSDVSLAGDAAGKVLTSDGSGNLTLETPTGGGAAGSIDDLTDVVITSPQQGQVLVYTETGIGSFDWVNSQSPANNSYSGLIDVDVAGVVNGDTVVYDGAANKWNPLKYVAGKTIQKYKYLTSNDMESLFTTPIEVLPTPSSSQIAYVVKTIGFGISSLPGSPLTNPVNITLKYDDGTVIGSLNDLLGGANKRLMLAGYDGAGSPLSHDISSAVGSSIKVSLADQLSQDTLAGNGMNIFLHITYVEENLF